MSSLRKCRRRARGFTLVEVLMVISALAIMAGIVIPQVTEVIEDARSAAMLSALREVSSAIERYRMEHTGDPPDDLTGHALPQVTGKTDGYGNVGQGPGFTYGPYLPKGMPINPLNGSADVFLSATSPPANLDQRVGWVYYPDNGQIWGGLARVQGVPQ